MLLLEVIKTMLSRTGIQSSYFISLIIGCLQFLFVIVFILFFLFRKLIPKRVDGKKRLAIVSVLIVFTCIGAEFLATFLANNPRLIPKQFFWAYRYFYDYNDSSLSQYEKKLTVYDSGLFYRLKPNSNSFFSNREFNNKFSINTAGLRDDESSLKNPSVICLGDSYTMGWGVEQEESFPQQIEKFSGLNILNAGISSYGTARELELLKQLNTSALKFIIIQYCSNDEVENNASKENQYHLKISSKESFDSVQTDYNLSRRYFPGKNFLLIGQLFLKHQLNKIRPFFKLRLEREIPFDNSETKAITFLDILCNAGIAKGNVKIIVTVIDSYARSKNDFLNKVGEISRKEPYKTKLANCLSVVSFDNIIGQDDYYLLDQHIRASGHKKIAIKLWEEMQKN